MDYCKILNTFLARLHEVQGELLQSPRSSASVSASASAFPSHCDKVLYTSFSKIYISTATHQKAFIFHGPVILPYILKTVWCMNIILQDYESVWPNIWPQNKYRSLWPIFHGPVILPYILKTVWYMNTILWYYESEWPDVWPQNKCRSLWPIFHGPVILPYILKTVWCMNIILQNYESVWPDIWPQNKCRSLWPIFHGPVILPCILKPIWYMNTILWDYESVWPDVWPKIIVDRCDLYFMVQWFCLIS